MAAPLLIPAAITAGSALMGFLGGKSQAAEAARVEAMNRQLSALDSEMNPFVKTQTMKQAQPEKGPGAMGGLFKGALSGASQAMVVNDAMNKANFYKQMADLRAKGVPAQEAARVVMGEEYLPGTPVG